MSAERSPRGAGDDGMTVMEVIVASAILMVVMSIMFGVLASLTTNENRTQALVTNEQHVRLTLNDMSRDLRAANPLTVWSSTNTYATQVQMETGPTGNKTYVRWTFDTTALTLSRQIMSDNTAAATVVSSTQRLRRVRNAERGIQMFEYYDAHAPVSAELVTDGADPTQIANCAIRVRITVTADSEPGPEPFTESLDVHLRNRLPGGTGC